MDGPFRSSFFLVVGSDAVLALFRRLGVSASPDPKDCTRPDQMFPLPESPPPPTVRVSAFDEEQTPSGSQKCILLPTASTSSQVEVWPLQFLDMSEEENDSTPTRSWLSETESSESVACPVLSVLLEEEHARNRAAGDFPEPIRSSKTHDISEKDECYTAVQDNTVCNTSAEGVPREVLSQVATTSRFRLGHQGFKFRHATYIDVKQPNLSSKTIYPKLLLHHGQNVSSTRCRYLRRPQASQLLSEGHKEPESYWRKATHQSCFERRVTG